MEKSYDYHINLVVLGDTGVGRTCLVERFTTDTFTIVTTPTIGADYRTPIVQIDDRTVQLYIWEATGQERLRRMSLSYVSRAKGIILVYDVTRSRSFGNIHEWYSDIKKHAQPDMKLMILGNKCDLEESRVVTEQEGRILAAKYGAEFFETSAKSGQNVAEAIVALAKKIIDQMSIEEREEKEEQRKKREKQEKKRKKREKQDKKRKERKEQEKQRKEREKQEKKQKEREKQRKFEWRQAYSESLRQHGSVSVEITQCILVGPPATGKSTLKHFLVHNAPKAIQTSTAVMDTPEVVRYSSEQYAVDGGTCVWQSVEDDVMGKSLYECIASKAYNVGPELPQEHGAASHTDTKNTLLQRVSALFQRLKKRIGVGIVATKKSSGSEVGHGSEGVADMLYAMRERSGGIELRDASFIHLLDTGGQPSFQDALPLLLVSPCTYIQVFNAAHDLDQPVPITYRPDEHTEEVLSASAETGWEMMLRSFSGMQTMAHKCSKELAQFQMEGSQLPQFRIFMLGTHKDQLIKEGRHEEAVQNISERLSELEGKPYYHCIKRDPNGQPFYLLNSTTDEEGAYVNRLRRNLSSSQASFKLAVPLRWYACKQYTHNTAQKFFLFEDLKAICLKHQFIDPNGAKEQFHSLLKLFSLFGFYVFFELKDVPDEANYICTDKGIFLKEVSKLLAVQFLQAPKCHAVDVFKQHGIISSNMEVFEELGIIEEVERSWFLAALQHVGLLARYASPTKHSSSYFMPAALPQGKTKLPDCSTMASLCVTFEFHSPDSPLVYTDLPRGIFCRLAVELSNGPWTPIPKESDRTTVKFYSEEFELYLAEAPGFISLTPVLVEELEGKNPLAELHKLCRRMYDTLHKSIVVSAEGVLGDQFCQTATTVYGVECYCRKVPHLATPVSAKVRTLICQATKERQRCLSRQRIWFVPVESTKLVQVDGGNMWVMEETGYPSSDPPQMGHLQQKVHAQQSPACSLERTSMSLRTTDSPQSEMLTGNGANDTILSQNVYDHQEHLVLFRVHVSRTAAAKGRAILEGVGLDTATIDTCFEDHPQHVVEVVQAGLKTWCGGQGNQPPTWDVLLRAMEYAEVPQQHIQDLKTDLGLH